jgi:hypothetical protein
VEEITKKIIEAKKAGDYELVQKLQQEMDRLQNIAWGKLIRELEDVPDREDFPKNDK